MHRVIRSSIIASTAILCLSQDISAFAQSDVTQPGDTIIASSANSPGSEGVANAIDNQPTKYLNFDTRTPVPTPPSGFVVTPSVGVTWVIGISTTSANDAPERDPYIFTLEGCNDPAIGGYNDPTNTWVQIGRFTNAPFTARFQKQTIMFENFKPYRHYRWVTIETASANGCCMQVAEIELLGTVLPSDVTQPGDPVIASSANSPGSEGVANAIDNQPTKYLNFDTRTPVPTPPSGFVVSPSIGRTLINGIVTQSANDAPERDPYIFTLEGCNDSAIGGYNDPTNTWVLIGRFTNAPFTARFQKQTILFDNFQPFRHYRWVTIETASANGCCMQVAEIELLGTGAPKDVTQPSDALIASSANSPGSEGVANAIDNQPTKYLNFDTRTPIPTPPSGFIVTPGVGPTTVIGLAIQSANDAPERDPRVVKLEGSNDAAIGGWNDPTNTWEQIVLFTNGTYTARFQTLETYFPNRKAFKHYRWTVIETASANGCCMQVAEVEFLAVTQSNPCGQTQFTLQPANTPVLNGSSATFFVGVNGPWTLQWYKNGAPIPGATALTYTTPPVTAVNEADLYSCAIVGCQTSSVVKASIFTPSAVKSIGISWEGGGANGAPTPILTNDINGIQLQAYWNNGTTANGFTTDGVSFVPDPLVDSDNVATPITVDFDSNGEWGSGTGNVSPLQRMLNGLIHTANTPGTRAGRVTFNNVPAGNHALIAYTVHIPLHFQNGNYWAIGQSSTTNYIRPMNADEYNAAPGFYRGSSANPAVRPLASYVRFDNVQPLGGAGGSIELGWDTATSGGGDRGCPVNAVQLILNAPDPGSPPVVTADPQPVVALAGSTINMSVTASGQNLTYQWLKNGRTLVGGGNISGVTASTLTISGVSTNDEANYSVAVFNPAGSAISRAASLRLSTFSINEALVGYWKLDEASGAVAANSVVGGSNGVVSGTATWGAGRIGNALGFDASSTYMFVSNYPKAKRQMAVSAWVNLDPATPAAPAIIRNADGNLDLANPAEQFEFGFVTDINDGLLRLTAAIVPGPNFARVTDTTPFTLGSWQHIAFSADGAQLRVYKNGVEIGSLDYPQDINPPGVSWLSLGARLVNDTVGGGGIMLDSVNPAVLFGQMDDVGIWTRGLSATEVSLIYQAGQNGQPLSSVIVPTPSQPPTLSVGQSGGNIVITYTGVLQSSTVANGPYTDVGGATSPYSTPATGAARFFRARGN
jgi:hypothetical protein